MKNDHAPGTPARLLAIFIIAGSVVVMILFCLAFSGFTIRYHAQKRPMQSMMPLGILIAPDDRPLTRLPAPHLELDDGHRDFTALNWRQLEKLNNYGWTDRSNHIARIPIKRAIDLAISHGFPVTTNLRASTGSLKLSNEERKQP